MKFIIIILLLIASELICQSHSDYIGWNNNKYEKCKVITINEDYLEIAGNSKKLIRYNLEILYKVLIDDYGEVYNSEEGFLISLDTLQKIINDRQIPKTDNTELLPINKNPFWCTLGYGVSTLQNGSFYIGLNKTYSKRMHTVRLIISSKEILVKAKEGGFFSFGSSIDKIEKERFYDIGSLIGFTERNEKIHFSAAIGLALVVHYIPDTFMGDIIFRIGLPFELKLSYKVGENVGLGATFFATVTTSHTIGGIAFALEFGE